MDASQPHERVLIKQDSRSITAGGRWIESRRLIEEELQGKGGADPMAIGFPHEHECSLSAKREALDKQADVELQTLALREQVLREHQYKDYVLNKLAQQIYRAHNVPVELSVEKSLQEITASNLFMAYALGTTQSMHCR